MKNYLIIGIVAIIVVVGGTMLVSNYVQSAPSTISNPETTQTPSSTPAVTETPVNTSANPQNVNVVYSENGFSPNTITIKAGTTVTWTNKNSDQLWVASNPHPTHTDLPGFDEMTSINTDGTFSYTFTKTGTWGYHNHKNPSQGGTVIVQP